MFTPLSVPVRARSDSSTSEAERTFRRELELGMRVAYLEGVIEGMRGQLDSLHRQNDRLHERLVQCEVTLRT
jgi:hypothetical protein